MKLKEIPVYLDLIDLPWSVVWSRIQKRIGKKDKSSYQETAISDIGVSTRSIFQPGLDSRWFQSEKFQVILGHYLKDELNYLGTGWVSILNKDAPSKAMWGNFPRSGLGSTEPDWNRDHRTGFHFDISGGAYSELQKAFSSAGVDVKWSWEFARMHHLPQMALAASTDSVRKKEILQKAVHHIRSFIEQNPYGKGVHWSSPMEVAIRLVNVLVCRDIMRSDFSDMEPKLLKFTAEHWHFLHNNLENKDGFGTNHYLANLMGLIVSGYYLEGGRVGQVQSWAVKELENELIKQFHEDGFNFEYSTYYHRLSTEIVMISLLFAQQSGVEINTRSYVILAKALRVLEQIKKPDETLPLFGDNDSGRILNLDPAGFLNGDFEPRPEDSSFCTSALLQEGVYKWFYGPLLDKLPNVQIRENQYPDRNMEWCELKYRDEWKLSFPRLNTDKIVRSDFKDAGVFIFRSNDLYLAVNLMSNPKGHRYRGHMHNDKGSFEFSIKPKNIVRDPGIFSYTASIEDRNFYRSTQAHPVPFAGIEQNRFLPGALGLFHMKLDVECELLEISQLSLAARIIYRGVKHIRRFQIFEDYLLISDFCNRPFVVNKESEVPATAGYGKKL